MRIICWFEDEEKKDLRIKPVMVEGKAGEDCMVDLIDIVLAHHSECWVRTEDGTAVRITKPNN